MNPNSIGTYVEAIKYLNSLQFKAGTGNVDIDRAPENSAERERWGPVYEQRWTTDMWTPHMWDRESSSLGYIRPYKASFDGNSFKTFVDDLWHVSDKPDEPIKASTEELTERMSAFADEIFG